MVLFLLWLFPTVKVRALCRHVCRLSSAPDKKQVCDRDLLNRDIMRWGFFFEKGDKELVVGLFACFNIRLLRLIRGLPPRDDSVYKSGNVCDFEGIALALRREPRLRWISCGLDQVRTCRRQVHNSVFCVFPLYIHSLEMSTWFVPRLVQVFLDCPFACHRQFKDRSRHLSTQV